MSYFGGKGGEGVYQTLINQIPPHLVYVEACLGGGAVMRHKLPALLNVGCDPDAEALEFYQRQSGGPESVELLNECGLEFLLRAFGGETHLLAKRWEVFRLERWRVKASQVFVYFDPPYLLETRKSPRDRYRYDWEVRNHYDLLQLAVSLECRVMITHYPHQIYSQMLSGWRTFTFQAPTRSGLATEQVWMNYPEPEALHDYRYLGRDRREREKIRRRVRNWTQGIRGMSPLARKAVLAAIVESNQREIDFSNAIAMSANLGAFVFPPAATLEQAAPDPDAEKLVVGRPS